MKARRRRQLRIIGGRWRGRRLSFADADVRPTADRRRETLFNWLQPVIPGAHCLDLFAGSGALGLEALSRGAERVLWTDRNPRVVHQLRSQLATLDAPNGEVRQTDALALLRGPAETFDVVFLDPPFGHNWLAPCCELLAVGGWLTPRAWIYMEARQDEALPELPGHWQVLRQQPTGQVVSVLVGVGTDKV